MEDSTSAPAARGGLPAPPTAATRLAGAVYHREQDWRLRINTMDDTLAPSSTFPISAPAPRSSSGGARPPLPSLAPPATKKKRALFVAPHPRRQQAPSPGDVRCTASGIPSAAAWDATFTASASSVGYIDGEFSPTRQPIFDWTPTPENAAEDPRPPCSQPFMNLLTQDNDADLQLLMQENATPSKRPPKRGSNYSLEEDIQLCKSWMNVSNDPIVGTDQPGKTYWERIAHDFHRNKDFESDRTANSLEHRCQLIVKDCMRFHGFFEEIERCHPSGVPYQEHMILAQALYASKNSGKRFPFVDCWLLVRHSEKFAAVHGLNKTKNKKSSKSTNLNLNLPAGSEGDEGGQDTLEPQESSSKKPRPPGRKQSKEKLKRGEGDDDEYKDMMKSLVEMKAKEMKRKEEVDQHKLELEERRLQWEQEHKIMFCDVSKLDQDQKTYVMARRAEIAILAAKRAKLLESSSVSESGGASVHCSSV